MISLILGVFVIFLILMLICDIRFRKELYDITNKHPGGRMYPIVGNIMEYLFLTQEQTFSILRQQALNYKKSYFVTYYKMITISVIRANEVELILNNSKNINKSKVYEFLHSFLGTGLLTSNGNKWLQRRRLLTPAFHFNILQNFHKTFINETNKFIEILKQKLNEENGIEIENLTSRFTLNTICETAMGIKPDSSKELENYRKTIFEIGECIVYRLMRPYIHFHILYNLTKHKQIFLKYVKEAHKFTKTVIKKRKELFENESNLIEYKFDENIYETKKTRYAMLDTLLAAQFNGENINDDDIREEVDTFMFEGHDTTSSGLIFIFLLLAHHPEAQEKILNEILLEYRENEGRELTLSQYNNMNYFDRVIKECLRIYPPVAYIGREITQEIVLDDVKYPVGTFFQIHIYDLHRDPEQFPNPEKFDPDRFLPENIAKRNPYGYIPFSAGPRNCIGQKFALLEIKTLISKILMNFKILPVTKREDVVFMADLVLRSSTRIKVKFQYRNT